MVELAVVGCDSTGSRDDGESILLRICPRLYIEPVVGVLHTMGGSHPHIDTCRIAYAVRDSAVLCLLGRTRFVSLADDSGSAVLFVKRIAHVIGTLAHTHPFKFAVYVVRQFGHGECQLVNAGALHLVGLPVEVVQTKMRTDTYAVLQHLVIPIVVGVLEMEIDLPISACHFGGVVEVDVRGHIMLAAAPFLEQERLFGTSQFGDPICSVGKPRLGIRHHQLGFHIRVVLIVIALIDVLERQQVDTLHTIGGDERSLLTERVFPVQVGKEHLQIKMVGVMRCRVLVLVQHPVTCLYGVRSRYEQQ